MGEVKRFMKTLKNYEESFDITKLPNSFIEYGKDLGKEKASLKIAVNLLAENLPLDLIAKTTGLSKEKVLELKVNLEEGKKAGEAEIIEKIAENLIAGNIPTDIILRTTDLSREEIIDLKKALEENQKEGFEKGREVGIKKTMEIVSLGLLEEGIPANLISSFTGIEQNKLEKLKEKIK